MKLLLVFGTRPEAIKMCPIVKELEKQHNNEYKVCLTGQHKEMLSQIMSAFGVYEDYNLQIMKENQSLASVTADVITKLDGILEIENPDLVLVHGDTTSAMAAGLAAFYRRIPVGHVEAGLRTYNMDSPFPEEFNRQAIDLVADMYFAPTICAKENLVQEGKNPDKIFVTGNTAIDALKYTVNRAYTDENLKWASDSRMILFTAHRRENIGKPMSEIFGALKEIVKQNEDVKVIYPVHKNPKVREIANELLTGNERIRLIEPLDVMEFHNYLKKSFLVMTDSGGIQEEAPSLGVPVLVMRDTTERPEGIEAGTAKLIGVDRLNIIEEVNRLLVDKTQYAKMSTVANPYGDGFAAKKIIEVINMNLGK